MQTQLTPQITREGNKAQFNPQGDLLASNVGELRNYLKSMIADGVRELVFDLGSTGMVDSSGVGLLVATHNSLSRLEGKMTVINVSLNLMDLFKSLRLDKHFIITGSNEKKQV